MLWATGCHRHVPQRGLWDMLLVAAGSVESLPFICPVPPTLPAHAPWRAGCVFALTKASAPLQPSSGFEEMAEQRLPLDTGEQSIRKAGGPRRKRTALSPAVWTPWPLSQQTCRKQ